MNVSANEALSISSQNDFLSDTKRTQFSRNMKDLRFQQIRHDAKAYEEAFEKLQAEIQRLSCLAYDKDQTYEVLCVILWKAVEGEPRPFHAWTKDEIELVIARAVEETSESIDKYTSLNMKTKYRPDSFRRMHSQTRWTVPTFR